MKWSTWFLLPVFWESQSLHSCKTEWWTTPPSFKQFYIYAYIYTYNMVWKSILITLLWLVTEDPFFWSRKGTWEDKASGIFQNENHHSWHIFEAQKIYAKHNDYIFFREGMISTLNYRTFINSIGHNVKWSKSQVHLQWLRSRKIGKIIKTNAYPTLIATENIRHKITILYLSPLFSFLPL